LTKKKEKNMIDASFIFNQKKMTKQKSASALGRKFWKDSSLPVIFKPKMKYTITITAPDGTEFYREVPADKFDDTSMREVMTEYYDEILDEIESEYTAEDKYYDQCDIYRAEITNK